MNVPLSIVAAPTVQDEIKGNIIDDLREMLVKAEAGEIEGLILVAKYPSGKWSDRRSGCIDFPGAIGYLEIVKQAWIAAFHAS